MTLRWVKTTSPLSFSREINPASLLLRLPAGSGLSAAASCAGSVDLYGRAMVSRLAPTLPGALRPSATSSLPSSASAAADDSCDPYAAGWAGMAFSQDCPSASATASHLGRAVRLYDGDLLAREVPTTACPTAVAFLALGAGNVLGVTQVGGPRGRPI